MSITTIDLTVAPASASTGWARFDAAVKHRTAPLSVPCTGSNSVFGTPAGYGRIVPMGSTVRDAKQAAPPRGELR